MPSVTWVRVLKAQKASEDRQKDLEKDLQKSHSEVSGLQQRVSMIEKHLASNQSIRSFVLDNTSNITVPGNDLHTRNASAKFYVWNDSTLSTLYPDE
ncbi:uncharacterized protein TRUGW13939_06382 [Talaromyces rugulosus]|uniref:Uncharacterized protein n=1 Tax=Talaromyces rugulosus TaxID=121627 RepID=A0A7H8QYR3_TALRU|nr:uncharacterized protein TRUGW13939_06382 [Talaromyces rugulosus]QKX59250.1 hypothetical protein TRUGW13939_06382 [Talaromyces rugulosus]